MVWYLLPAIALVLTLAILLLLHRRAELRALDEQLSDRAQARHAGTHKARLQYPRVDLSRCLGCGTCISACPEEGVLGFIHGQAAVIHGARCVGHGRCAAECPTGAIQLTLGDLESRKDIPVLNEHFEVIDRPGLFLAGEVTGFSLIRTAISHGTAVADEVTRRSVPGKNRRNGDVVDLCIVGAGPAGIAASLRAKQNGLNFCTLDQEGVGGTVAKYPRRKLVMTQPVQLPLHGKLKQTTYTKEELMELWQQLVQEYSLPIHSNTEFRGLEPTPQGPFLVKTSSGDIPARHVCLALGRRGTPRRLGVPGEDLPKVAYSLIDAQSYQGRRILVAGGGDSAIEAALGLAEQPGNRVTLSYRKSTFSRLKARNESRIREAIAAGRIDCLFCSEVREIGSDFVNMDIDDADGVTQRRVLPNDDVFVMIGGVPPFQLLESAGVSFDPKRRPATRALVDQGTGLLRALIVALVLTLVTWSWLDHFKGYYQLPLVDRPGSSLHAELRPTGRVGLAAGVLAATLILANLCYLIRRSRWGRGLPGSLQAWMTSHVGTGVLVLLLVLIHSAMAPRHTVGGHALLAMILLIVTGSIGRYLYAFVPRAANGQELALEEIHQILEAETAEWDRRARGWGESLGREIRSAIAERHASGGPFPRLWALATSRWHWRETCTRLHAQWHKEGLAPDQIARLSALGQRAYRTSLAAASYEDLRGLLSSWRYIHRWVAWLMVLLVGTHILAALRYARILP